MKNFEEVFDKEVGEESTIDTLANLESLVTIDKLESSNVTLVSEVMNIMGEHHTNK